MRRYETHITALEDRCASLEQAFPIEAGIAQRRSPPAPPNETTTQRAPESLSR
jgi:hypothetical protein